MELTVQPSTCGGSSFHIVSWIRARTLWHIVVPLHPSSSTLNKYLTRLKYIRCPRSYIYYIEDNHFAKYRFVKKSSFSDRFLTRAIHFTRARSIFYFFFFFFLFFNIPFICIVHPLLSAPNNLLSYVCKTMTSFLVDKAFCFQNHPCKRYFFFSRRYGTAIFPKIWFVAWRNAKPVTQAQPPFPVPSATVYLHYKVHYTKGEGWDTTHCTPTPLRDWRKILRLVK